MRVYHDKLFTPKFKRPKFTIQYKVDRKTAANFHSHSGYEIVWLQNGEATYIFEEKVFHLYKLHGSLDWQFSSDNKTVIRLQNLSDNPIIIPPSNQKFEQSYQMPFFEMMSRFTQTLRTENTVLMQQCRECNNVLYAVEKVRGLGRAPPPLR